MKDAEKSFDQEYFRERVGLEEKHFLEVLIWWNNFRPQKVVELGCGLGHRVFAFNEINVDCEGCDLEFPIINTPYKEYNNKFKIGTITDSSYNDKYADLVIIYDVLEHLPMIEDVKKALKEAYRISKKYIMVSIPVIGDPNLKADKTHMIKKTMQWWEYQVICAGFKLLPKPNNVPYREQMIWAEKI